MITKSRKRKTTGLVVLLAASAAAFGAYAFTASNTVPDHYAGAGSGTITGYSVSNVSYTFNGDGTKITAVAFNLDAAASDVDVSVLDPPTAAPADWVNCGASTGLSHTVTCSYGTGIAVGTAAKLTVVAVSSGSVTIA